PALPTTPLPLASSPFCYSLPLHYALPISRVRDGDRAPTSPTPTSPARFHGAVACSRRRLPCVRASNGSPSRASMGPSRVRDGDSLAPSGARVRDGRFHGGDACPRRTPFFQRSVVARGWTVSCYRV